MMERAKGKFVSRAGHIKTKEDLAHLLYVCLLKVFGRNITEVILFHIGGARTLEDPELFSEGIIRIFGEGAVIILDQLGEAMEDLNQSGWEPGHELRRRAGGPASAGARRGRGLGTRSLAAQ